MGQLWRRRSVLAAGIVGVAAAGVASGARIAWRPAATSAAPAGLPLATATITRQTLVDVRSVPGRLAYGAIIAASIDRLADNRFATFVVSEIRGSNGLLRGFVPLTIDAHQAAGARPYNDAVLLNVIGSTAMRLAGQWNTTRKMGRHHQYVLTFVKGNPKAATEALLHSSSR